MRRALVTALAAFGLLITGCSSNADDAYMDTLRDIYPTETDANLEDVARAACSLLEADLAAGATGSEAAAQIHATALRNGLSDADATRFTVATIGGWCPTDIS